MRGAIVQSMHLSKLKSKKRNGEAKQNSKTRTHKCVNEGHKLPKKAITQIAKQGSKKSCNNTIRTDFHSIAPKNTLQHKKKQTTRPERQKKTRKWHREKPAKNKKQKSEHFGNKNE